MATVIDGKGFPRVEADLNLGVIQVANKGGKGNEFHNPATGQFTFAPPGVRILEGAENVKNISTSARKLIFNRAKASGANQMAARVIDGRLHIVLLVDGERVHSFAIASIEERKAQEQQDKESDPTKGAAVAKLSDAEKDFVIQMARDLSLSGEALKERASKIFEGISPAQIQQILVEVDRQRILDLVHYLDQRFRIEIKKLKVSDNIVRVGVGRGFLRRSFSGLDDNNLKEIVQRLEGLGWTQDEVQQGLSGKLPKRLKKNFVKPQEKDSATSRKGV